MFLVIGKFAFIWFSKTVNYAANDMVNNAGLIGRMDMPKTLFPVAVIWNAVIGNWQSLP